MFRQGEISYPVLFKMFTCFVKFLPEERSNHLGGALHPLLIGNIHGLNYGKAFLGLMGR
uniref:Uncharacterized protein n=1 Tax=Picea sitchensis TaxID=3332 RepID=A9NY98_PICSI|nr:unknown [Picea sitchensis]